MTLADDVNLVDYVAAKDDLSGADIKVCVKLTVYCMASLPMCV